MNCPRHHVSLERSRLNDREVDRCPECAGLWIAGSAVDAVVGRGELLKLRSLCSVRQSSLACPHDNELLGEGKVGPVVVDLCLRCNGLWLDPGELEMLHKRRPPGPHRRISPEVKGNDLGSKDPMSELVLFSLLGIW